jgi:diguanylate cyclase (GGDEF)-like protein
MLPTLDNSIRSVAIRYLKYLGLARGVLVVGITALIIYINVQLGQPLPADQIELIELVTEGLTALIFLAWLVILPNANLTQGTTNLLFFGFLLMYTGFFQAFMSECMESPPGWYWKLFLGDLPIPLGTAIASVGFFQWARRQAQLRRAEGAIKEKFKHLSLTDELTNLGNNRALHQQLEVAVRQAAKQQDPLAAAMLDLDRFKYLNDTYGHQAGDEVLRQFGQLLLDKVRDQDLAFRYGGEEFTLLLSNTTQEQAYSILERIRLNLMQQAFHFDGSEQPVHITVSVGVAELRPTDESDQLLQRADRAVYQAKRLGRNRTVISEE